MRPKFRSKFIKIRNTIKSENNQLPNGRDLMPTSIRCVNGMKFSKFNNKQLLLDREFQFDLEEISMYYCIRYVIFCFPGTR